ncbi:fibronectin type III-like domain-contianing protein [Streptomyces sp. S.PNR 29]|uniref:fibronectin type III-like domain-contianing protein n=1 Tax=Streptomyces sp. S.PNR 29 TaxID=2973805 RepID=UPI0025B21413|nr:fibronectin type III-like domain-contianing protein [Streptomyces sp. S.PNR 29]MDN0200038.1 fibronectin type III-like domain-contianing protein [Streptomyces sp. S.PNR 29]
MPRPAQSGTVVLLNGGVVTMEGRHDEVDAVVEAWLPGQAGGAVADVLRLSDTPSYLNFPGQQGHVRYGEGVMVGYRYYETADIAVRCPFGHGLSYTTFDRTGFRVTADGPDTAAVSLTVTNTGDRFGKHVVQVYVTAPRRPVSSPARELRGFAKVALAPGESTTVEIALDRRGRAVPGAVGRQRARRRRHRRPRPARGQARTAPEPRLARRRTVRPPGRRPGPDLGADLRADRGTGHGVAVRTPLGHVVRRRADAGGGLSAGAAGSRTSRSGRSRLRRTSR